ncbi:DUF3943 domain-containing protein [uncultured Treponema sp.]|uniref:DUF3943 domain-containing protein n=1 Tax=uncultured Treponema sp. TaxID=162155 RepID=UPI0025CDC102|nr:DUF3943 domain-containing protein [uncultured Treponema sp.]
MKKLLTILFIFTIFSHNITAQSESESGNFSARDIVIAAGDVFLINIGFNSGARIILQEDYAEINLSTMNENLHKNWCWDKDGFFMNQFGHPYQGSLYFNAGRSNGLNFWQSFLITAGGSLMWEEFGETTCPAVNDFITTPICGSIVGETLHRLYIDASEIFYPLGWIVSPMDAINTMCKGKSTQVSGRTEEIDFIFHGGSDFSHVDFSSELDSETVKKISGGHGMHIQYGLPEAHDTKEPFDLFTADLDSGISSDFYKIEFCIDGFLYSRALYFEESQGTLGLNLIYEGEKSSIAAISNAALGAKYLYSMPLFNTDGKFNFFTQLDGIFLGTRSLYRLSQDIELKRKNKEVDRMNPPRTYNFGAGVLLKSGFSIGSEKLGTLYAEAEINYLIPYIYSKLDESEATSHFAFQAKASYEHKISNHFSLGLNDTFIFKADKFAQEADTRQFINTAQIYAKLIFARK